MPTKIIYLGLYGAVLPDSHGRDMSEGNKKLDELGKALGGAVYAWGAANYVPPKPGASKPWLEMGYIPTKAMSYLIDAMKAAGGKARIRLFGWSTGAVMLCAVARSIRSSPKIPADQRYVDMCFAFDPLWSLEFFKVCPTIPDNVLSWYCVRQNANGDRPPLSIPSENRFWQGIRLERENAGTQYHEINVATGSVIGNPGFVLPTNTAFQTPVNHGQVPIVAYRAALATLRRDS